MPEMQAHERCKEITANLITKYRNQSLAGFAVLFVGLAAGQYIDSRHNANARNAIVDSARVVLVEGCNRDFRTMRQVRGVLQASRLQAVDEYRRGEVDKEQHERRLRFYETQLNNLKLPDCHEAVKIVTANPDRALKEPTPLRP